MREGKTKRPYISARARLTVQEYRRRVEAFIEYFAKLNVEFTVLDIACGDGFNLEILRWLGFEQIYGLETDEDYLAMALDKGLNVRYGSPYDLEVKEIFNVVLFCDAVHVLSDPELAMTKAHMVLREDGLLYLTAPVRESLPDKFRRKSKRTSRGIANSKELFYLMEKVGFKPVNVNRINNRLPFSSGKRSKYSFGGRFGDYLIIVAKKVAQPKIVEETEGQEKKDEDVETIRANAKGDSVRGGDTES